MKGNKSENGNLFRELLILGYYSGFWGLCGFILMLFMIG